MPRLTSRPIPAANGIAKPSLALRRLPIDHRQLTQRQFRSIHDTLVQVLSLTKDYNDVCAWLSGVARTYRQGRQLIVALGRGRPYSYLGF
jgi:hypothetical protein